MDIREYIQSGIIEQYVLGLANVEEVAELEQARSQYPELNDAVISFEKGFEQHLMFNVVQPPTHIKSLIEQELFAGSSKAKVVETAFESKSSSPAINIWKWLAAACIILLVGSTTLNFYFWNTYKNSKQEYEALLLERNTLQANNASYKQSLDIFQDTSKVHIQMKGTPGKEDNLATVLWDKKSKEVYIYTANMQQIPSGKQYQLWAIVDRRLPLRLKKQVAALHQH